MAKARFGSANAATLLITGGEAMTLEQLQDVARAYFNREVNEDMFYNNILDFLDTAAPADYMAFAEWLLTQGSSH
jgi:hypothetical protein